jgi:hypothetical protein
MTKHTFESIRAPVKVVIWDLDDTFWSGTLSEGGVGAIERNLEVVRALADRGIVSSICSKNDPDDAQARLREMGAWGPVRVPAHRLVAQGPGGRGDAGAHGAEGRERAVP